MFFGLHTTRKAERDILIARKGEEIMISPKDFHGGSNKAIVCEEGTARWYEHNISDFHELLRDIEFGNDPMASRYMQRWFYKFNDVAPRVEGLPQLLGSIKKDGIKEPVHCEITGERLDGSYRTKIAMYLGIKEVKAIMHKFKWQDIDEDFIERKLKARALSSGKDYYEFEYGYKDWKNVDGGAVYRENAERDSIIVPMINGKTVLDVGCNEGYISLQAARQGKKVEGIDIEWNHLCYLNKLIFEWIDKKNIKAEFFEERIEDSKRTADSILMLNVLYHIPREKQKEIVMRFKGKQIIFQCNLRKKEVRDEYYTSHTDDLCALLKECGIKHSVIEWRDKPIVVCEGSL